MKYKNPNFNVVLVEPQIPQNTGNIARLCAALCVPLHLIEPLGFEINDRNVKRAGLDYWEFVDLRIHANWQAFIKSEQPLENTLVLLSTKASKSYLTAPYVSDCYLVFGNETKGLSDVFHRNYSTQRFLLPMKNHNVRSLNLSSAVAAVAYEAERQINLQRKLHQT